MRSIDHEVRMVVGEIEDIAMPGSGASEQRLATLYDVARRHSLSVARIVEAHTDALAIINEFGRVPPERDLYGVWASQDPQGVVELDPKTSTVSGTMAFASGIKIVDRALVRAKSPDGTVLIDVALDWAADSIRGDTLVWATPAMVDAATGRVVFDRHPIMETNVFGTAGWYLERIGFWQGACAPAACWAGGAAGIVDVAVEGLDHDAHRSAQVGALVALEWSMRSLLDAAGRQLDSAGADHDQVEATARALRFAISDCCRNVLDRFGRAFGPRPHVTTATVAQRCIDLDMYLKQHHGEREYGAIASVDRRLRNV